jgi:hypothetical protein
MLYNFWFTSAIVIFYSIICIKITEIIKKTAFDNQQKITGYVVSIIELGLYGFVGMYVIIALGLISICSIFTNTPIERCIGVLSNQPYAWSPA